MNIGIDLDGVVFDTENYYKAYADLYNYEHGNLPFLDRYNPRVQNRYDWTEEMRTDFLNKYLLFAHETAPILPCAKIVIQQLRSQGHKLIVITRRGFIENQEIDITHKRCEKEDLHFDKLIFAKDDKLEACKEEQIDIMIEDYFVNVEHLSNNGIPCIYFQDSPKQLNQSDNVLIADNWGQIPALIHIFGKRKQKTG